MKCEEFEEIGLGLAPEGSARNGVDAALHAAAIEHVNSCPRCAALQESWQEAQAELQALRLFTQAASAPPRVEMRLRQEFRTRHRTVGIRKIAVISAWALAAAAVLVGAANLRNWRAAQRGTPPPVTASAENPSGANATPDTGNRNSVVSDFTNDDALIAANDAEDFTVLPGSFPQETNDGAVIRVRLQRGALAALGLPVNEQRAGEWIQVDLLVGEDGQPQAVRLPQ